MEPHDEKHLVLNAFRDLAPWQKAAVIITGIMTAPFLGFLALVMAVSLFPFILFGRWEGDLGRAPLQHEFVRAVQHRQKHTDRYYEHTTYRPA